MHAPTRARPAGSAGIAGAVFASQAPWTIRAASAEELLATVKLPYDGFILPNGLRVVVHTDRKAPSVTVSVWYGIGSRNEPKGRTGFAHLFEHLMSNGSENVPGEFFAPLRAMGATGMNGGTDYDHTYYYETVPRSGLERTLFMEADRMGHCWPR